MTARSYHFGTAAIAAAIVAFAAPAAAEVRCDAVTPAAVESICGKKTHVVAGAGEDSGEKDCSRLLSADDAPGAKAGAVSVHLMKTANPLTQDPKWTEVKSVPGFDAAFSYKDQVPTGEVVSTVAAARGGHVAFVTMVGTPLCTAEQATQIANLALPAPSADSRGTAFEAAASGPETRDGAKLLVTAYAIIWLLMTAYLGFLWRGQKSIASRIDGLERAIDRAERAEKREEPPKKAKAKPKPKDEKDEEED